MSMQTGMIIVHRRGLPPFLATIEAAGQAQGGPADASAALTKQTDSRGTWAWNPLYDEWQLLHIIRSGDTLWAMSGTYYGERSVPGVHKIGRVEQNRPILGSDYEQAVPGDVILIPGLAQPGGAVPSPPGDPAVPPPGGAQPPGLELPGEGIDWTSPEPPDNWPPQLPWPPGSVTPPITTPVELPADIPALPPAQPAEPTPVGAEPAQPVTQESWWTTPRIALVGGLSVVTVGLIAWAATRGAKKPRKRRRRPQKRRRRR